MVDLTISSLTKFDASFEFTSIHVNYNTATMPHKKYYDLEKWEMAEYAKKQRAAMKNADRRQGFNDEEVQCVR